jgi:hypothetical protein
MDHRPYEDWLLDDERLTPEQDRDLRIHLRNCPECAALARGAWWRSARSKDGAA